MMITTRVCDRNILRYEINIQIINIVFNKFDTKYKFVTVKDII